MRKYLSLYKKQLITFLLMVAKLIDGTAIANTLIAKIKDKLLKRKELGLRPPGLAVILVNDDPASIVYVQKKQMACKEVGILSRYYELPKTTQATELTQLIDQLNQDPAIDGILIQLPLPSHLNEKEILELIRYDKDIDGFHPFNIGRLAQRRPVLRACTPYGIIQLLEHIQYEIKGCEAVIVGASNIVGRPMALELLMQGATVTICHRFTKDLPKHIANADLVIVAVGIPALIKGHWIKPGAVVIDVGFNRSKEGKLMGDVEFQEAKKRASWITPVPGGVGPMTVATLLRNTLYAAEELHS